MARAVDADEVIAEAVGEGKDYFNLQSRVRMRSFVLSYRYQCIIQVSLWSPTLQLFSCLQRDLMGAELLPCRVR